MVSTMHKVIPYSGFGSPPSHDYAVMGKPLRRSNVLQVAANGLERRYQPIHFRCCERRPGREIQPVGFGFDRIPHSLPLPR
jgi:hypothetical protein